MGTLTKNKFTIITSQKLNVGDEKHDPFIYYMEYSLRSLDTESVCSNLCKKMLQKVTSISRTQFWTFHVFIGW